MRQSSSSSPSYRAIEAAIGGIALHGTRRSRVLSVQLEKALLSLLDESPDIELLKSALDCCAIEPTLQQVLTLPIRELYAALFRKTDVSERVQAVLGVRAHQSLASIRTVVADVADLVESESAPRITAQQLRDLMQQVDLPAELAMALAQFFMAMAAAACVVAASEHGKKLRAAIASALVKQLGDGLVEILPWLVLVRPRTLAPETRAKLPKFDLGLVLERHAQAVAAREQLVKQAREQLSKDNPPKTRRTKDRRKYAAAS